MITASGKLKGRLGPADFLRIVAGGEVLERGRPEDRPSAETSLHDAIYGLFPEARACFHVHSIPANVAARLTEGEDPKLPSLEMIKGLGVWTRSRTSPWPSSAITPTCRRSPRRWRPASADPPRLPGFLIRDHGLTTWAADLEAAVHYLELFDYLFTYMTAASAGGIG